MKTLDHSRRDIPVCTRMPVPPRVRYELLGLAVAAAIVIGGCSGADSPYPVHGTVLLDGQPATELAGGTVVFTSSQLHKSASGRIEADGTYRLGSLAKDDGALPGQYEVSVSPPEGEASSERKGNRSAAKPMTFVAPPNLQVTVERKNNDIPIELHRQKPAGR